LCYSLLIVDPWSCQPRSRLSCWGAAILSRLHGRQRDQAQADDRAPLDRQHFKPPADSLDRLTDRRDAPEPL